MISTILGVGLLVAIWCFGVKISTQEDMLLEKLGNWANKKAENGNKIIEGFLVCEWCMPSFHSVLFVIPLCMILGVIEISIKVVFMLPFIIAFGSLLSGLFFNFVMLLNKYYSYIDKLEELSHFDIKDRKTLYYFKKQNNGN